MTVSVQDSIAVDHSVGINRRSIKVKDTSRTNYRTITVNILQNLDPPQDIRVKVSWLVRVDPTLACQQLGG
jgi:hypothetical protein